MMCSLEHVSKSVHREIGCDVNESRQAVNTREWTCQCATLDAHGRKVNPLLLGDAGIFSQISRLKPFMVNCMSVIRLVMPAL
jgi:hypothetical protein